MPTYIVSYDLLQPGQKYSSIKAELEKCTQYWNLLQSDWIVVTGESAEQIRDRLNRHLDSNDKLFVGLLAGKAAWDGFTQKGDDWLKSVLH